jgi:hypothetical protein
MQTIQAIGLTFLAGALGCGGAPFTVADSETPDAGASDTGTETGTLEAFVAIETATPEAEALDTGAPETATPDAGAPEAGAIDPPETGAPPEAGAPEAEAGPALCCIIFDMSDPTATVCPTHLNSIPLPNPDIGTFLGPYCRRLSPPDPLGCDGHVKDCSLPLSWP